jgi:type II secretory pathway pseudopilin PulG
MLCGQCGAENPDASECCSQCGRPLGATQPSPPAVPRTSGKAIASLILGLFGFLLFPSWFVAIVLGHLSKSEIRKSNGRITGAGLATAGLVLGYFPLALIIAAIAMPNLMSVFRDRDEASATRSLSVYREAMQAYSAKYPQVGFPTSFVELGPPSGSGDYNSLAAGLVPVDLGIAAPHKDKYTFVLNSSSTTYTINANPDPGVKGARYFFMDESGTVRASSNGPATASDNPI